MNDEHAYLRVEQESDPKFKVIKEIQNESKDAKLFVLLLVAY